VRKSDPKIDFEIRILPDGSGGCIDRAKPVLRENTIAERLRGCGVRFRSEPNQVIYVSGPIHDLPAAHIEGPAACMTQMLGFGQIGLAAPQLPLRFLCNRDIRYRSKKFDATRRSSRRPSYGMNISCRAIRHQ